MNGSFATPRKKTESLPIVWLRSVSVILILLCHITQTHASGLVVMTSQIFNVGVNIFIVISGFLFGMQQVRRPFLPWFMKRARRIFIPYWCFLLLYGIICLITHFPTRPLHWLMSIPGLQFFSFDIHGAEHTWFITAILLCYAATPIFSLLTEKLDRRYWPWTVTLLLFCPLPFLRTFNYAVFASVSFFGIAFLLGRTWDTIAPHKSKFFWSVPAIIGSLLLRFAGRQLFDGTLFYNSILATYTHYLIAFGALFLFMYAFDREPPKIIRQISSLSFEIYLCHNMYLWPPLSVFSLTENWYLGIACALAATTATSVFLKYCGTKLDQLLPRHEY